jgi:iron complex outermembrane receptor protein
MRNAYLSAALLAVLASPAYAQPAADTSAAAEAEPVGAGEIVVTAQRRAERLVDVPISITALSGDSLEDAGIRNTQDLTAVVPGLNFTSQGAFSQPTIRGVGTTVAQNGNEANIAMYIDGVYQANQIANVQNIVGIESIEVLKGPQGTLFGRNATGGAIRITTRAPSFTPTGEFEASYGNFEATRLQTYLSGPLADNVAVNLAVLYTEGGAYIDNIFLGNETSYNDSMTVRSRLLWDITESASLTFTATYMERSNPSVYALTPINNNYWSVTAPGYLPVSDQTTQINLSFDPINDMDSLAFAVNGDFDLGWADLTSVSSYVDTSFYGTTDLDRSNLSPPTAGAGTLQLPKDMETFVQELNLVSSGEGPFQWFTGVFYMNDSHTQANIITGNVAGAAVTNSNTEAMAWFGEVNYTVGDFTFIGGTRYSTEDRELIFHRDSPLANNRASESFSDWTPRVGVRYALTDNSNLYATWSEGFKSGLLEGTTAIVTIRPEEITAYEIGYKYGEGDTSFSISAYTYEYTDLQFARYDPLSPTLSVLTNAASAESWGVEAEYATTLGENLDIRFSAAYQNAEYTDFPNAVIFCDTPGGGNTIIAPGALNPCTGQINSDGASGNRMIRTPEYTLGMNGVYHIPFGDGSEMAISGSVLYSAPFFWSPAERLEEPEHTLINGEISYTLANNVRFALWGRNLLDEERMLYVAEAGNATGVGTGSGGDSASWQAPRTYGVSVGWSF